MSFETYLVRRSRVTPEQFVEAVERQQEDHRPIGQLAIESGKLSMRMVFDILAVQADSGQMFGDIAVEKAYLSKEDLDELLLVCSRRVGERHEINPLIAKRGDVLRKSKNTRRPPHTTFYCGVGGRHLAFQRSSSSSLTTVMATDAITFAASGVFSGLVEPPGNRAQHG